MNGFLNTVRAEVFKLRHKRRSYVIAGLLWVLLPVLLLVIGWVLQTRVGDTFADEMAREFGDGSVNVAQIVQQVASPIGLARNSLLILGNLSPSLLIIIVALTAALLVGEERTQNMWKTILTVQPNRLAVLSGKLTAAMLYLALLLFGSLVASVVFGALGMLVLPTSFGAGWGELLGLYGLQWLFALSATLFAFLLVWLFRSLPLGIVSIFFLPAVLEGGYTFYRTVVGFDRLNRFNAFLEALQLRNTLQELPRYFFTTNLYAPSRQPIAELAGLFGAGDATLDLSNPLSALFAPNLPHAALVMGAYGLLFGLLLLWSFTRRDIA
jgi:ABC-type transport system involved in multi-copper enzyme maturation permease subunit